MLNSSSSCVHFDGVKQGLPNLTELVAPLGEFADRIYNRDVKRTEHVATCVSLANLGWGQTELDAFTG